MRTKLLLGFGIILLLLLSGCQKEEIGKIEDWDFKPDGICLRHNTYEVPKIKLYGNSSCEYICGEYNFTLSLGLTNKDTAIDPKYAIIPIFDECNISRCYGFIKGWNC